MPKTVNKKQPAGRRISSGAHSFLKKAASFYVQNWKLVGATALVAILMNSFIKYLSAGEAASFYQSMWFVFVSSSLIWLVRHAITAKPQTKPSLKQVYWTGSSSALKIIVIFSLLALAAAPFSFGAFIFSTINFLSVDSLLADVVAAGVWLIFGLITLVLLARLMIALIIATLPNIGPFMAVGISWRLTRRQTLAISRRLAVGFIYTLILVGGLSIGLSLVGLSPDWIQIVIELITFGLVLPVFYTFLFLIYKEIS